ncbi:YqzE family protein [Paenibacillus lutrae]|uniref:YqzE family protein n=1 Tax=Paenibacillus lutrae TaxID=2078573 RepID=A0A7X3FFE9_9BACL|nr:YqzE family protein [Paenibacillus lutrae]
MAKGNDLVKYITQQVVQYIDTPKQQRQEAKVRHKESRASWTVRWFGMIPMSIAMWIGKVRRSRKAK